jgi:23S rRNA (guanosine2251-2'-O)-methyltransferase
VKNFRHTHRPKKSSLVIGREAVMEALRNNQQLDRIYLDTRAQGQDINEIKKMALQNAVPVNYVPVAKLDGFNINGHEGVVAQIAKVQYQNLQDVISFVTGRSGVLPVLLFARVCRPSSSRTKEWGR